MNMGHYSVSLYPANYEPCSRIPTYVCSEKNDFVYGQVFSSCTFPKTNLAAGSVNMFFLTSPEIYMNIIMARNLWYFGSKCYHIFSFATGILMW